MTTHKLISMAADDSPGLKSLEALIGGSLPENLLELSSTSLAANNDESFLRIDEEGLDLDLEKEIDLKHGKAKVPFHIATIKKPQEEYKILVNNANAPFEHVWLEKKENNLGFVHPLVSSKFSFFFLL